METLLDEISKDSLMIGLMIIAFLFLSIFNIIFRTKKGKKRSQALKNPLIFMALVLSILFLTATFIVGGYLFITWMFLDREINTSLDTVTVGYFLFSIGVGILYSAFKN